MNEQRIEVIKETKKNWYKTISKLNPGEFAVFKITGYEANSIRVAASILNRRGTGNYSVSIDTGNNTATVTNKV